MLFERKYSEDTTDAIITPQNTLRDISNGVVLEEVGENELVTKDKQLYIKILGQLQKIQIDIPKEEL